MNTIQSHGYGYQVRGALDPATTTALVLSCPDYGDDGQRATFTGLGTDVPIMVRQHLGAVRELNRLQSGVHIASAHVLVADTESAKPHLTEQFTSGSSEVFAAQVKKSVDTVRHIPQDDYGLNISADTFTSCLGTDETGGSVFLATRAEHEESIMSGDVLKARLKRVVSHRLKDPFYQRVYAQMSEEEVRREEARIMAEYLTIGSLLVGSIVPLVAVHCSPTADLLRNSSTNKPALLVRKAYVGAPALH